VEEEDERAISGQPGRTNGAVSAQQQLIRDKIEAPVVASGPRGGTKSREGLGRRRGRGGRSRLRRSRADRGAGGRGAKKRSAHRSVEEIESSFKKIDVAEERIQERDQSGGQHSKQEPERIA